MMLLPPEISLQIFGDLSKKDLKSVRLSTRTHCTLSTSYLFDTVYISCHQYDYDIFAAIAEHPMIAKCIKHFRYDASQFHGGLSKERYLRNLAKDLWQLEPSDRQAPYDSQDPEVNDMLEMMQMRDTKVPIQTFYRHLCDRFSNSSFVDEGYQLYMSHAQRQDDASDDFKYWKKVYTKLKLFSKLEQAEVYASWCDSCKVRSSSLRMATYKDILAEGSPLTRSWNLLHLRPFGWDHEINLAANTSNGSFEFETMNYLLGGASRQIRGLKLNKSGTMLPPSAFSPDKWINETLVSDSFWPYTLLESLDLRVDCHHDYIIGFRPLTGLQNFLFYAPDLQSLKLRLRFDNGTLSHTPYTLEQVFPQPRMKWHKLQELDLEHLRVDAALLCSMLVLDMPKLRTLRFSHIELINSKWEYVIGLMRSALNLSTFQVGRPYGLMYPDHMMLWSQDTHVIDTFDFQEMTQENEHFIQDIERYVVGRGSHPFFGQEDPQEPLAKDINDLCNAITKVSFLGP